MSLASQDCAKCAGWRTVAFYNDSIKAIYAKVARAEVASEENLETKQQNLVKSFKIADKLRPFQDFAKRKGSPIVFYLPRFPLKVISDTFASAEGVSEENLESRQQDLVKKFQNCCELRAFHDCANRTGQRMVAFRRASDQN